MRVECFGGGHSSQLISFYIDPNFPLTALPVSVAISLLSSYKSKS